ncbi:MAG: calcium/sodium antiporter [Bacteroidales bacterium]|nr:calcium/sodium antiporter [Bacteroidales bacterium]MCB9027703.1 calcium/sodium antiporter [Bacteroidales bacterium]MDD3737002.1 calcium/sodium antiporter [Bacteroidales bacterium]HOO65522.1 calcium/sodium antiporter [Bacteroidales bacterium]HPE22967.1 calcium/sodium antiporter [Bacteroidales bacterium]
MALQIVLLIAGLALLIAGAEWLVGGASSLARKFRISDLTIGLTVVAFGTSAPELVVNLFASATDHQDIFFGNILGSNNFNLFIILGIAGVLLPLKVQASTVYKEIPMSLAALVVFYLMVHIPSPKGEMMLGRIDGIILLGLFVLFQFYIYRQIKDYTPEETIQKPSGPLFKMIVLIILGLAGLIIGGRLVLDNAVIIAKAMGVSEKVIGLTIIAAGTSLPELATSVVAAFRKNADIAVGNIVGSNLFNLLLIGGTVSLVSPVKYSPIFDIDFYILAAGTVVLFINLTAWRKHRLDRWEAAVLLTSYIGYTIYLISRQG